MCHGAKVSEYRGGNSQSDSCVNKKLRTCEIIQLFCEIGYLCLIKEKADGLEAVRRTTTPLDQQIFIFLYFCGGFRLTLSKYAMIMATTA